MTKTVSDKPDPRTALKGLAVWLPAGLDGRRNRRALARRAAIVALAAIAAMAMPTACSKAPQKAQFKDATITLYMDLQSGKYVPDSKQATVLKVTDQKQLEALLAFFPEMDRGKEAWRAGGWEAGVEIKFTKRDGKTIRVTVSGNDDLTVWSEGHGDWPVNGDLKAFLLNLQKQQPATQPAATTQPAPSASPGQATATAPDGASTQPAETPAELTRRGQIEGIAVRLLVAMTKGDMPAAELLCEGPVLGWKDESYGPPEEFKATISPAGLNTWRLRRTAGTIGEDFRERRASLGGALKTCLTDDEAVVIVKGSEDLGRCLAVTLRPHQGKWLVHDVQDTPDHLKLIASLHDMPAKPEPPKTAITDLQAVIMFKGVLLDLDQGGFARAAEVRQSPMMESWDIGLDSASGKVIRRNDRVRLLALDDAKDFLDASRLAAQRLDLLQASPQDSLPAKTRFFCVATETENHDRNLAVLEVVAEPNGPTLMVWTGRKVSWPATKPAQGPVQTDWSAPREGVQMRLRAARKTWRADEIPALRWDARNVGTRKFLAVGDGQRLAQLEVDGVWYQWLVDVRGVRLADLGAGAWLEDQLVTVSPIWSQAKSEDLEWRMDGGGIVLKGEKPPLSLHLKAGPHTLRLAIVIRPSRVDAGDGFRVVSEPMDITIEAPPAGQTASWPPGPKLTQAVKEALHVTVFPLQDSPRPFQPKMKDWIARALAAARLAAREADRTPLHASARRLADALAQLQRAVDKDPAGAEKEFSAAWTAYGGLVDVLAGITSPTTQPAHHGAGAQPAATRPAASTTSAPSPDAATTQPAAQPATQPAEMVITPGVGVGPITLGMSKEEVIKHLGKPVRIESEGGYGLNYISSMGLSVLVSRSKGVVFISCWTSRATYWLHGMFVKDFRGATDKGIRMGAGRDEIVRSYGKADSESGDASLLYMDYRSQGVQFMLRSGKLAKIDVVEPDVFALVPAAAFSQPAATTQPAAQPGG